MQAHSLSLLIFLASVVPANALFFDFLWSLLGAIPFFKWLFCGNVLATVPPPTPAPVGSGNIRVTVTFSTGYLFNAQSDSSPEITFTARGAGFPSRWVAGCPSQGAPSLVVSSKGLMLLPSKPLRLIDGSYLPFRSNWKTA